MTGPKARPDRNENVTNPSRANSRRELLALTTASFVPDLAGCSLESGDPNGGTSGSSEFRVRELTPTDVTVTQDDTIEVSATIINTGEVADTQDIAFRVDGTVYATESFSLDPGTDAAVSATLDTDELDAGEYTHSVASADDERSGVLTVEAATPNVIFFMADDMGYADTSVDPFSSDKFGSSIPTPNLEEMARNGARFTSHYNGPAAVCTPSRAALLTGSYPSRVGIGGGVYFPRDDTGMHPQETTIADLVQAEGYATGMIGKWHLGDDDPYLPPNQGFDTFYGTPYSNNMNPFPLIEGLERVEPEAPNAQLTRRYTDRALQFIEEHQDEPFFLYLPHNMPHIPLGTSDEFDGATGMGTYPDLIHELDWSTGQILDKLDDLGIEEDTLVVFSSDDGPWLRFDDEAGSAGPLRNGKASTFEGGARAPTVMYWPGTIPGGTVCDEMTSHIDMLPTVANLMGTDLPDNEIDGEDITPLLENPETGSSPHDHIFYYRNDALRAIRNAEGFKYHFVEGALYDLESDIVEQHDISAANPGTVDALQTRARSFNDRLQENSRAEGSLSNIAYLSMRSMPD